MYVHVAHCCLYIVDIACNKDVGRRIRYCQQHQESSQSSFGVGCDHLHTAETEALFQGGMDTLLSVEDLMKIDHDIVLWFMRYLLFNLKEI